MLQMPSVRQIIVLISGNFVIFLNGAEVLWKWYDITATYTMPQKQTKAKFRFSETQFLIFPPMSACIQISFSVDICIRQDDLGCKKHSIFDDVNSENIGT